MHIPDMAKVDEGPTWKSTLLAIGWLERGQDFAVGNPRDDFFPALIRLVLNPWQPSIAMGAHSCSLCVYTGGPKHVQYQNLEVEVGINNLYVPTTDDVVYFAPSTIVHYVDSHAYCPPIEFQEAVIACPEMRSMAYLKLLSKHWKRDR